MAGAAMMAGTTMKAAMETTVRTAESNMTHVYPEGDPWVKSTVITVVTRVVRI